MKITKRKNLTVIEGGIDIKTPDDLDYLKGLVSWLTHYRAMGHTILQRGELSCPDGDLLRFTYRYTMLSDDLVLLFKLSFG